MDTLTADLCTDAAGNTYLLMSAWGARARDTGARTWDPRYWAGPLAPEEVAILRARGVTAGIRWREDFPPGFESWEEGEQIWAEPLDREP